MYKCKPEKIDFIARDNVNQAPTSWYKLAETDLRFLHCKMYFRPTKMSLPY